MFETRLGAVPCNQYYLITPCVFNELSSAILQILYIGYGVVFQYITPKKCDAGTVTL